MPSTTPMPAPDTHSVILPVDPARPAPILTTEESVQQWPTTPGFQGFVGWLKRRCERIKGKDIVLGGYADASEPVQHLMRLLDQMIVWVDEIPPEPQSNQRFGNLAFRAYISLVEKRLPAILSAASLPPTLSGQIIPLLIQSHAFGHPTRLDYGTGHELAFVLALWCCVVSGWIGGEDNERDEDELILRVFPRYLDLVTMLQKTYRLEPAGSHGVWGLDDYCFLPYLFGSAQLYGSDISPTQALVNATATLGPFTDLYTLSLHRVTLFKRGAAFSEHSPLLHSLSQFPTWNKPHSGLLKMFLGEVLGKRVVVQGLWIGGWGWGANMPKVRPQADVPTKSPFETQTNGAAATAAPWKTARVEAANTSWGATPRR